MGYDFTNLSAADFEDLSIDLISEYLGVRFESFGPGPDGGIDGRHSSSELTTILQAKHYPGSSASKLEAAMKKERKSIDKLTSDRYLLTTSSNLSPKAKYKISKQIGPSLRSESDIFSLSDLNKLLRDYPEVERANIKLWLSSSAVLDRIVYAASHKYTQITKSDINERVKKYAQNPSFDEGKKILDENRVLIISGPPGVGKTTLAEMLSYAYSAEGWQLVALRGINDGYTSLNESEKQIFFFDDFLGKVALDRKSLTNMDSEFNRFIGRIKKVPNKRFVLTTRAYIFEEARRISEYLSGRQLDISKYLLDVGVYTRKIRARILYNHLAASEVSRSNIVSLIQSDNLFKIIDHPNYNPRIIEWMTDPVHFPPFSSPQYPGFFLDALENPDRLWEIAFREHIPEHCRNLLYAIYFCEEDGVSINDLREMFNPIHRHLSEKYGKSYNIKDFEEALKILEGGFICLNGNKVSYINPSLRDFMRMYINTKEEIVNFATSSSKWFYSMNVWRQAKIKLSSEEIFEVAVLFSYFAKQFSDRPELRLKQGGDYYVSSFRLCDLDNIDCINLLLEWWDVTKDRTFLDQCLIMGKQSGDDFDALWHDRTGLLDLVANLIEGEHGRSEIIQELSDFLSKRFVESLNYGVDVEDLDSISDTCADRADSLPISIANAIEHEIKREFSDVYRIVDDLDSESSLQDYMSTLQSLSSRAQIESHVVQSAVEAIEERISVVAKHMEDDAPSFNGNNHNERPQFFTDKDIKNLFSSLIC